MGADEFHVNVSRLGSSGFSNFIDPRLQMLLHRCVNLPKRAQVADSNDSHPVNIVPKQDKNQG
jgi:hypothetical protein